MTTPDALTHEQSDIPPGPRPPTPLILAMCVWALAGGLAFAVIDSSVGRATAILLAIWVPMAVLLAPLMRRPVRPLRPHWQRMVAGVVMFAVAATTETVTRIQGWTTPAEESVSDLVSLAAYILLASGILSLVKRHGRREVRSGVLDATVMLIPPLVLMIEFVIHEPGAGEVPWSWPIRLLATAYPFADVALLATLVWLAATPTLTRAHLGLLIAGFALNLWADLLLAVELLTPSDPARRFTEALYPLTYALIAAGVARGATTRLGRPREDTVVHWGRVGVLGFGAILGPMCIVVAVVPPVPLPVLAVGSAALASAVFIVWRMLNLAQVLSVTTTQLARARRELTVQATHDPLTGLLNRSVLDDVLDSLRDPGSRPAALLSIDLDRFKSVNDTYGHGAGDDVLRATASRLRRVVRPDDIVIRMGGDEFLAAMPGVNSDEAHQAAARLIGAIEEPVEHDGAVLLVSASVGVALLPTEITIDHLADAVAHADAAMYAAKRAGAGQVGTASHETLAGSPVANGSGAATVGQHDGSKRPTRPAKGDHARSSDTSR